MPLAQRCMSTIRDSEKICRCVRQPEILRQHHVRRGRWWESRSIVSCDSVAGHSREARIKAEYLSAPLTPTFVRPRSMKEANQGSRRCTLTYRL